MRSVGPAHRGDGDQVMAEVHEDVDVLPVVEGVGALGRGALDEPGEEQSHVRARDAGEEAAASRSDHPE